jgi:hypothetical protein
MLITGFQAEILIPSPQMLFCIIILPIDPKFSGVIFSNSNSSKMSHYVI